MLMRYVEDAVSIRPSKMITVFVVLENCRERACGVECTCESCCGTELRNLLGFNRFVGDDLLKRRLDVDVDVNTGRLVMAAYG
jgi:hypothetical protein